METTASMTSDTSWMGHYRSHLMTPSQALQSVKSGDHVYIDSNAAAPQELISALVHRSNSLTDVQIYHLMTLGPAPYAEPQYKQSFRANAFFIGSNVRDAVNEGRATYTPVFLSEVPNLFVQGVLPIDVCLLHVSAPDEHGYCSYGVSVDCAIAAQKGARLVIAQVNKSMPRTLGQSFIHVSDIDSFVEVDCPLPELVSSPAGVVEMRLGEQVASLIENGATLQLGIGQIPNAVLSCLRGHRDLGVHTEMFSDGVVNLVESGVITNSCKTILPGKIATSFVMGSKRLYDFVDNNPIVEFAPSDFINDPWIIAQNYKMTSINSAMQIDLTGQVCSVLAAM